VVLGGFMIPNGTQLLIPSWTIHRDPNHWSRPLDFWPERWDQDYNSSSSPASTLTSHHETKRQQLQQQYVFLPFGAGPRKCLGQTFAFLETKLAIALLLRDFEILLPQNHPDPDPEMAITLRCRNGFHCLLRPRLKKLKI
jgi:cytochrome P450